MDKITVTAEDIIREKRMQDNNLHYLAPTQENFGKRQELLNAPLSAEEIEFINKFDNGKPYKPFSFTINPTKLERFITWIKGILK